MLYTLVAPLIVLLLTRLPLPGLDTTAIVPLIDPTASTSNLSLGALGIMPYVTAAFVVEIAALVVPSWRPLRDDDEGRDKLTRATILLSLLFATYQAWGVLRLLDWLAAGEAGVPLLVTPYLVVLSLIAGYCVTFIVATLVSARGAINGVVAIWLSAQLIAVANSMWTRLRVSADVSAVPPAQLAIVALAAIVAVGVTTWAFSRDPRVRVQPGSKGPYRTPGPERRHLTLASPATGIIAVTAASTLPSLASSLGAPWPAGPSGALSTLLAGAIFAVAFTHLFHRRLGDGVGVSEASSRQAIRHASVSAVAFTLLLLGVGLITRARDLPLGVTAIALLVAAFRDGREHAARAPSLVALRSYQRPVAAEAARLRLAAHGIFAEAKDRHTRAMFHFFGPFVPMALLVPAADAERARELLQSDATPLELDPLPWRRHAAVAVVALLGLWAADRGLAAAFERPAVAVGPPVHLELKPVVERPELLDRMSRADDVPRDLGFDVEVAPDGAGRSVPVVYGSVVGDTVSDEIRGWLGAHVPAGHSFAWARLYELDDVEGTPRPVGYRSYLLRDEVILDGRHVESASAMIELEDIDGQPRWYVTIVLDEEGARRFEAFTAANLHRRVAILLDGEVHSAPEIRERIAGGTMRITMGDAPANEQREAAERLAAGLTRSVQR
ncbi:MAG: DUF2007 domain-containing protein [Polyangiaceae bacterium]